TTWSTLSGCPSLVYRPTRPGSAPECPPISSAWASLPPRWRPPPPCCSWPVSLWWPPLGLPKGLVRHRYGDQPVPFPGGQGKVPAQLPFPERRAFFHWPVHLGQLDDAQGHEKLHGQEVRKTGDQPLQGQGPGASGL